MKQTFGGLWESMFDFLGKGTDIYGKYSDIQLREKMAETERIKAETAKMALAAGITPTAPLDISKFLPYILIGGILLFAFRKK